MNDEFDTWSSTVPAAFTQDKLWRIQAYRLALYLVDLGWEDTKTIRNTIGTSSVADQLYRSLGSISANIAEGFSRQSSRDKARFYEYALGSARESRGWFYKCRHVLSESIVKKRLEILTSIIRLLITMIPQQRNQAREEQTIYHSSDEVDPG